MAQRAFCTDKLSAWNFRVVTRLKPREHPHERGGRRKSDKNGDFPVALSCAASCRAFGATLQTSCLPLSQSGFSSRSSSPQLSPPCRFFLWSYGASPVADSALAKTIAHSFRVCPATEKGLNATFYALYANRISTQNLLCVYCAPRSAGVSTAKAICARCGAPFGN